ncbi:asparagine synthetase A [Microcystis aeruginosa]|nr:asparagine synthetase A [Microcystis aeruginosa]
MLEKANKSEQLITPKQSWKTWNTRYLDVLEDPWYKSISEVQNLITVNTVKFYSEQKLKTLHLPITTNSVSSPFGLGSDSLPVKINLFGVETYLSDSMQFLLEYGCRLFQGGCYYIMHSFRGEEADRRHLCQFYHSEAEIIGTWSDAINLVEKYLSYLCRAILEEYGEKLLAINGDNSHIERLATGTNIPQITHDEALNILNHDPQYFDSHEVGFKIINKFGEQKLMSIFEGEMVWVTHYDHLALPFYQAYSDDTKKKALNADLLMGIGEVVGLGERHQKGDEVLESLRMRQINEKDYSWYYDMKKKYPLQTSGFGLGIERFLLWIFKHDDIRDCQIFPRFNGVEIIP